MSKHTLALIITFFISWIVIFFFGCIFIWVGWLHNYLSVFVVSLAISVFGLIQALIVERKKKKGNSGEQQGDSKEKKE